MTTRQEKTFWFLMGCIIGFGGATILYMIKLA